MKAKYFNFVREMAYADFKLRYQGSILGVLWSFLRPLVMFGVLYLVFSKFARFDIPNYQFYLLLGVIMWNFFAEATSSAMSGLVNKAGLIRKVNFSKSVIVISSVLIAFINLIIGILVFLIFLIFHRGIELHGLFPTLLLLVNLFFVAMGVGLFLSALNSKFKDVTHLWELLLPIGFWLTPIIYSASMVPPRYDWLLEINPIYQIIEHSRKALIYGNVADPISFVKLSFFSLIIFILGLMFFQRRQKYFAEEL
jgi:ABC-type polysaccharide/polyol phosphate export permease